MTDISTRYLGLELSSPVILASGPLTQSVEGLRKAEAAGAGAVVLKSIFEEQIDREVENGDLADEYLSQPDAELYYSSMSRDWYIDRYMELLIEAKKAVKIPVIASINCRKLSTWLDYADRFAACGADAIELNYFPLASDADVEGRKVDDALIDFARKARKAIKLPLSIKLGQSYSSLSNIVKELEKAGIDGVVFFNRAFRPDIDLENLSFVSSHPLSDETEYSSALRWTALMSAEMDIDIAANTGIHSGETAVKMLLAGAKAVEVLSAPLKSGYDAITEINDSIRSFMEKKNYSRLEDFTGLLAQENRIDGDSWERVQFLKTIGKQEK